MTTAPIIAALVSAIVVLITISNWRYGLISIIAIGVLQDVLRKLTPEVPSYYLVWSVVMFAMVAMVALSRRALEGRETLWMGDERLKGAFYLYFMLVAAHSLHALLRWNTPVVPIFGLLFYFGPIIALVLVLAFARNPIWMKRFVSAYLLIMVPVCLTVYLSPQFKDSIPILREVGSFVGRELIIYDGGTILYSYSGLLRVGEIAAFHAAISAGLLSIVLYQKDSSTFKRAMALLLIILLLGAIFLTGRRKMLMALSIYWVLQFTLLNILRTGFSRGIVVFGVLGLAVTLGVGLVSGEGESSLYLTRGASVFGSVSARVETSVDLFQSALNRSSWLGLGAGVASQGMRYTGVDMFRYVGGSSESGIGLIAVELGLPGILVLAWLALNVARVLWTGLQMIAQVDDTLLIQSVSYLALLLANVATFATATQLYGDYFVLITLGVLAGGLYACVYRASRRQLLIQYLRSTLSRQEYAAPA
jgi:hypothetical protein